MYTDVKGPIEVPTFGGKRYVQVIVNDCSGFITAHLMASKNETV